MVLWALFFLSALAVAIGFYVRPQMSLAYRLKNKVLADFLAQAAVKRSISEVVNNLSKDTSALKDPWGGSEENFKNFDLGQGNVSIINPASMGQNDLKYGFTDEERKLNINKQPAVVLQNLFTTAAGLNQQQAGDLAASIVNWRGLNSPPAGGCADDSYYRSLNPPYACKGKDFEMLEELLLVKGMTRQVFDSVKNYLTVFGAGQVNINTAGSVVLQSLGLSGALADKIVHFRQGADGQEGTSDDNVLTTTNNMVNVIASQVSLTEQETAQLTNMVVTNVFCVRSDYFMGIAQGTPKGSSAATEIAFVFNRDKKIRLWKES